MKLHDSVHPVEQQIASLTKQGFALTGRNSTGPTCCPLVRYVAPRSVTDDDDRRQRAKQYWPIGGPVVNHT